MEAYTLIQGFLFVAVLMAVVSAAFLGTRVKEEDDVDLAGGPIMRIDRGKQLAQTVRVVMRLKKKMRRFKEQKNVQKKTA